MVALSNNPDQFLSRTLTPFRNAVLSVDGAVASTTFHDLPCGIYAISSYHDVNGNGKLDSNLFGIPNEPYGFSNNAKAVFGPPDFDAASFRLTKPGTVIEILLD